MEMIGVRAIFVILLKTLGNRLYRYELRDDKLVSPKLLLDLPATPWPGQNGGSIRVGPDKNVYLAIGDTSGSCDEPLNGNSSCQFIETKSLNYPHGVNPDGRAGILRVTQDGDIVESSILGTKYPLNLYYAYGIRNSFGLDFDPVTGNLWDTENGTLYGDEINLVEAGFNSGWNKVQGMWKPNPNGTLGDEVTSKDLPLVDFDGKGKYSKPEFIWRDTVGPTAIAFINSDKLGKKYSNDILVGDIKYGNLYHFDLNDKRTCLILKGELADKVSDGKENEDIIFGSGFQGISDMQVGPDGYLYILSYYNGAIFRVVPIQSIIPKQSIINLLDNNQIWKPFGQATLSQNDGTLTINVDTNNTKKIYNRSFLPTKINYLMNKTLLLNLDYVSKSDVGNATFSAQIIENSSSYNTIGTKKILWSSPLHNTSGNLTSETFILPEEVANKPVEFRLNVIKEGKGEHTLTIKKANIVDW